MARSMRAQWPSRASMSGKHLVFLLFCSPAIAELIHGDASTVSLGLSTARFSASHRRLLAEGPGAEDAIREPDDPTQSTASESSEVVALEDDANLDAGTPVQNTTSSSKITIPDESDLSETQQSDPIMRSQEEIRKGSSSPLIPPASQATEGIGAKRLAPLTQAPPSGGSDLNTTQAPPAQDAPDANSTPSVPPAAPPDAADASHPEPAVSSDPAKTAPVPAPDAPPEQSAAQVKAPYDALAALKEAGDLKSGTFDYKNADSVPNAPLIGGADAASPPAASVAGDTPPIKAERPVDAAQAADSPEEDDAAGPVELPLDMLPGSPLEVEPEGPVEGSEDDVTAPLEGPAAGPQSEATDDLTAPLEGPTEAPAGAPASTPLPGGPAPAAAGGENGVEADTPAGAPFDVMSALGRAGKRTSKLRSPVPAAGNPVPAAGEEDGGDDRGGTGAGEAPTAADTGENSGLDAGEVVPAAADAQEQNDGADAAGAPEGAGGPVAADAAAPAGDGGAGGPADAPAAVTTTGGDPPAETPADNAALSDFDKSDALFDSVNLSEVVGGEDDGGSGDQGGEDGNSEAHIAALAAMDEGGAADGAGDAGDEAHAPEDAGGEDDKDGLFEGFMDLLRPPAVEGDGAGVGGAEAPADVGMEEIGMEDPGPMRGGEAPAGDGEMGLKVPPVGGLGSGGNWEATQEGAPPDVVGSGGDGEDVGLGDGIGDGVGGDTGDGLDLGAGVGRDDALRGERLRGGGLDDVVGLQGGDGEEELGGVRFDNPDDTGVVDDAAAGLEDDPLLVAAGADTHEDVIGDNADADDSSARFEADMGADAGSSVSGVWRLLGTLAMCSAVLAVGLFLTWGQIQPRLQALAGTQRVPVPSRRPPLPTRGAPYTVPEDMQPRGGGMGGSSGGMPVPPPQRPLQPSPSWDAASWDGWDDDPASGSER